ncbi:hypothetical protein CFO_g3655 [Ceratocystis platani]|uniref:Uncharacterized protein n=1 Tax=Ceratocystis fimbriata f. sp. platani TaxID=88771 RepID=A0A0F8CTD6_CERFI|nr:hypothetical protein CFO_g3655 [Ceratocystis platani]
MRFFATSLPLALSLLGLAQATILEDNGYQKVSAGTMDAVLLRDENGDYRLIDAISFHPWMKTATIYAANNDVEPEHQNKLGAAEIYTSLAEEHKRNPKDIDWIIAEVVGDLKMEELISNIRQGRNVKPGDEVTIVPSDKEWKSILDTKYYAFAALVNPKAMEKVIVRTHTRSRNPVPFPVDSFHFYFPGSENGKLEDGSSAPGEDTEKDDGMKWEEICRKEWQKMLRSEGYMASKMDWGNEKQQAATFKSLFALEEEQEYSSLLALDAMIAGVISSSRESYAAPAP